MITTKRNKEIEKSFDKNKEYSIEIKLEDWIIQNLEFSDEVKTIFLISLSLIASRTL